MYRTRSTPRLLRRVNNEEYATNAHHEDSTITKSPDEAPNALEDINRDPDSGSDAGDRKEINLRGRKGSPESQNLQTSIQSGDRRPDVEGSSDDSDLDNVPGWKRPASSKRIGAARRRIVQTSSRLEQHGQSDRSTQARNKPAHNESYDEDATASKAEDEIFSSSQGSKKRLRAVYGKAASKRPRLDSETKSSESVNKVKVSFRRAKDQVKITKDSTVSTHKLSLAKPKGFGSETPISSSPPTSSLSAGPAFRRPVGLAVNAVPTSTETSAQSKDRESPLSLRLRSSSLSSLSSPEPPELLIIESRDPSSNVSTSACPICSEPVDATFKADFLIERCQGGRMNLRLQQLFCKAHHERSAKQTWHDRNYPKINWEKLHKRLEKHNHRIEDVLSGKIKSHYRKELTERLKSGKTKTTLQTWNNEAESRTNVGYYGSRGEQAMTNHIIVTFGEEIRRRAGSDKVIAAMGISGGVTGYLQSVLVPELALALIMEDSDCAEDEGRRILAESSGIGETLNELEEEMVPGGTARLGGHDSEEGENEATLID